MAQNNNKRLYAMLGFLGVLILYMILSKTVFSKKSKVSTPVVNVANNLHNVVPKQYQKTEKW